MTLNYRNPANKFGTQTVASKSSKYKIYFNFGASDNNFFIFNYYIIYNLCYFITLHIHIMTFNTNFLEYIHVYNHTNEMHMVN